MCLRDWPQARIVGAFEETLYRLAVCYCTLLVFACHILLFQKQVCAFNKTFLGPARVLSRTSPRHTGSLEVKLCLTDPASIRCC